MTRYEGLTATEKTQHEALTTIQITGESDEVNQKEYNDDPDLQKVRGQLGSEGTWNVQNQKEWHDDPDFYKSEGMKWRPGFLHVVLVG